MEQLHREQIGLGFHHLVQKPVLAGHVHWFRFVDWRDAADVEVRRFQRVAVPLAALLHGLPCWSRQSLR